MEVEGPVPELLLVENERNRATDLSLLVFFVDLVSENRKTIHIRFNKQVVAC